MVRFHRQRFGVFVNAALRANVSYFATRRELYGLLAAALDRNGTVDITNQEYITVRTFLTSRDTRPNDQARLAYEVALLNFNSIFEEALADDEE